MRFIELQIIATALSLIGGVLLIFKKKDGWVLSALAVVIFAAMNYKVGLYILIIPCVFSVAITLAGWFKWRKDERRKKI